MGDDGDAVSYSGQTSTDGDDGFVCTVCKISDKMIIQALFANDFANLLHLTKSIHNRI